MIGIIKKIKAFFLKLFGKGKKKKAMPKERKEFKNEDFLPVVVELLKTKEKKTVTIPLRGISMRPFLENDRDAALLTLPDNVKVWDPVLAEISPGHFVLHRILKIDGEDVTLMGDGNLRCEYCKLADIRAGVVGFYRKGRKKLDRTDGLKWRTYSWIWMHLLPLRRYFLSAHSRIWLKIFKPKKRI